MNLNVRLILSQCFECKPFPYNYALTKKSLNYTIIIVFIDFRILQVLWSPH